MSLLKAFSVYGAQIDNTRSVVATIGEISTLSLTQTREHSIHSSASYPETTLIGFVYRNDDGVLVETPAEVANLVIMASDWIYSQMRGGHFTSDIANFRVLFNAQFNGTLDLGQVGTMVEQDDNFAPAFVTIAPKDESHRHEWRFWLADAYFLTQFDVFENNTVAPIVTLDRFFEPYAAVKTLIENIDPIDTQLRINQVRGVNPETVTRVTRFDWVDPSNPQRRIPTYWRTVIYGNAGDSLDQIKASHREFILENSQHGAEEWAVIFPALFASAELIISPRWDQYALPNMERETGVFSGILTPADSLYVAINTAKGTGYTEPFVTASYEEFPTHFRGLMCTAIPGPDNSPTMKTFRRMYPDYANIPYDHLDFGKMSDVTMRFVLKLQDMLRWAEEMDGTSSVPQGYQRLVRDGIVYLATGYEDYSLLVTTKFSVDAVMEARP